MVGWHHQLNGYEFEQTLGDSEGQGSLACCIPWSGKQSEMIQPLNATTGMFYSYYGEMALFQLFGGCDMLLLLYALK